MNEMKDEVLEKGEYGLGRIIPTHNSNRLIQNKFVVIITLLVENDANWSYFFVCALCWQSTSFYLVLFCCLWVPNKILVFGFAMDADVWTECVPTGHPPKSIFLFFFLVENSHMWISGRPSVTTHVDGRHDNTVAPTTIVEGGYK